MAAIKSIKVGETTYNLKATYDGAGNVIDTTYVKANAIPTKTSQLQNDSGYLTEHQDISELATKGELEGKVDKELGKGLSEANYTKTEKEKLSTIANNANNYVHPTTSGNKHIPSGGADGQLLSYNSDGTAQWSDSTSKLDTKFEEINTLLKELNQKVDLNINIDLYSYGVEWDITVSSPILTRIGNPLLHKSLPIQSAYRGCVANNDIVNYYLYPDDWAYKEDGITPSVLDGTDGTVRVHTPKFYGKSGSNGNKRWVRISLVKIDDSWVEIPELLIDAYRSTVDNTVSETPKAVSVVNTTEAFRGGGNRAQFDKYLTTELDTKDAFRSDLGKPRTNISRATMRTYAINAGSELLCYEYYKWIFYWAWVIEYATFNSQAPYIADLTSDGYHQGGLGDGITNMINWGEYNSSYPLTSCGYGNDIGNFTGVKNLVIPEFTYPRYSIRFNSWIPNSAVCTSTNGSDNSKVITEVKDIGNYAFYHNSDNVWGSTTYYISGLTGGQKVIFKEKQSGSSYVDAVVLKEVTEDGEVTVNWGEYNKNGQKYVGFSTIQAGCNIKIYNLDINTTTITKNAQTLKMPRWRGFDNPFGDIWTNLDGVVIVRAAANEISTVYTTTNISEFTDVVGEKTIAGYEVASDGCIKAFDLGETAEIIPSAVGGSDTTYICDHHYCNASSTQLRVLLVGGCAFHGGGAGLGYFASPCVGAAFSFVGFRTLNRVS